MEYSPDKNVFVGIEYSFESHPFSGLDELIRKYKLKILWREATSGIWRVYYAALARNEVEGRLFCTKAKELEGINAKTFDGKNPPENPGYLDDMLVAAHRILSKKTPEELASMGAKKYPVVPSSMIAEKKSFVP